MQTIDIKHLRNSLGLSQTKFASMIGVSLRSVQMYEKGSTKPSADVLMNIIELNNSITKDSEMTNVSESNSVYNKNEASEMDINQLNIMFVPLVNQYAYAGYLNGFADEEFIDELPKIPFTNGREAKGEYLCFEVRGDSMDDGSYESYLDGDILLCRNVRKDYWLSKLHIKKWDFVIVHKNKGILVKRILEHKVEEGILLLHSLNEYYDDFEVYLKDVDKIFNIVDFRRKRNRR